MQLILLIKLTGAAFAALSAVSVGFAASQKMKMRLCELEAILKTVESARSEVNFSKRTPTEIFNTLACSDEYGNAVFLKKFAELDCDKYPEKVKKSLDSAKTESSLSNQDFIELEHFLSGFGGGDTGKETARCALYTDRLSQKIKSARVEYEQKGRLYRSLSWLAAAATVILLI